MAKTCTRAYHDRLKACPALLVQVAAPAGVQLDENGRPELQLYRCRLCNSTIALPVWPFPREVPHV